MATVVPRIGLDLLEPERDALVVPVDVQDLRVDRLALLEQLRGVPDVARPGHVGDVQQAVHARLQLHEGAEVGEVAHLALHPRARLVALARWWPTDRPRPASCRARSAWSALFDLEHHHLDGIADVDELRGVAHPPRPRHLRDVHESLHAGLQLDEGAVVRQAHDAARHLAARPGSAASTSAHGSEDFCL